MAKRRKNATALFEVMAATRARRQAEGSGPTVASSAVTRKALAAAAASAASAARGSATDSPHAPPPGARTDLKPLGSPAIVKAARGWVAALVEKTRAPRSEAVAHEPAVDEALDPTAGMTGSTLSSRGAPRPADALPDEPPAPAAGTRPVTYTTVMPTYGRSGPSATPADVGRPGHKNKVAIDRDGQRVTLNLRFNTAVIGGFAVVVVLGLAYIMGKRAGAPDGAAVRTPSSKEIKGGPVQPGVLDPQQKRAAGTKKQPPAVSGDAALARDRVPGGPSAGIQPSPAAGLVVTSGPAPYEDAPVTNGLARRTFGLNYCVIESYKPEQQEIALEVRDFLNANGVPCTIEIGSSKTRTAGGSYVLVGTRGFVPGGYSRSPEFNQYKQAIDRAGDKFGQKSKFNRPQTLMVKWVE